MFEMIARNQGFRDLVKLDLMGFHMISSDSVLAGDCTPMAQHGWKSLMPLVDEGGLTRQLTAFMDVGPMKRTHRISPTHSHPQTRCSHAGRDRREGAQCWRYCC